MTLKKSFIFLLCIFFSIVSFSQNDESELYEKANRLFDQNRFDLALNFYKELTEDYTPSDFVLFRKGFCYLQCYMLDDAIRVFDKLLITYPDHQQGLYYLAYAFRLQEKYDEAQICYDKLALLNPTLGSYWQEVNQMEIDSFSLTRTFSQVNPINRFGSHEIFISLLNDKIVCASTSMDINMDKGKVQGPNFKKGSNQLCHFDPNSKLFSFFAAEKPYGYNVSHISFSEKTGMIAYMTNNFFSGMRQIAQAGKDLNIYFAHLDEKGNWIDHIPFAYNDVSYSCGYPCLTDDGATLYFASNMSGGYGGFDIYVSYLTDEGWTIPQNLGPRINTPGDEISPYFDGNHLYFSSDWHPGYGGMDVFRANFDYEAWENPMNLGKPINSNADDFGFIFIERFNKGYFISNRAGKEMGENIYEFGKSTKKVIVQISDYKKKLPISGVLIDLSRCGVVSGITDESGEYSFYIQEGFDCYIGFTKVGYAGSNIRVKYNAIESHKKVMNIMLTTTSNFFEGQINIKEQDSIYNIPGVYISAINEVDGEVQETYSDEYGKFNLQIKPRGRYFLSLAKTGYRPIYKNIKTENKVEPGVLGTLFMERADNIVIRDIFSKGTQTDTRQTDIDNLDAVELEASTSSASTLSSKNKSNKTGIENKVSYNPVWNSAEPNKPIAGYVIQVAAIARKNIDIAPFKNYLSEIGSLYYIKRDDNLIRIMLGVYKNRSDAQDALMRVHSKDKFKESFISELPQDIELFPLDNLVSRTIKITEPKPDKKDVQQVDVTKKDKEVVKLPKVEISKSTEYMVQIGKFKNLNWFDNRSIEKIGLIEERREGGYILVLLSGYISLDEALVAKEQVRQLGYKDAFIVTPGNNGELQKVKTTP